MADPATYRPAPGSIPQAPGVYRFLDEHGRVLYVGKAKSLRARLASYFTDIHALHPRTQHMVTTANSVEWTVVATEVEALQLEYTWIKEFDPRFNVKYRDDKSYPSLAVTLNEEYPQLKVMRGPKRKGVRYFGPYAHAWAIRETLDLLLRVFPARTCSTGVFRRAGQVGRPCLLGYIDRCAAPCVGRVSAAEHRRIVEDFCDFMAGQTGRFLRRLEGEMRHAAEAQDYERAARLRDDIAALRRAMEKQAVVLPDGTDADVIAFARDELEAAVQVFYVRGGRVRGQRGWVVDTVGDVTTGDLVEQFLTQEYLPGLDTAAGPGAPTGPGNGAGNGNEGGGGNEIPREVLVPELPPDAHAVTELLGLARGSRVDLRVPQRGDKRTLFETVERNAKQALALHRTKRASDLTARSRALSELQEALELPDAPLRIECFDISNTQGSDVVASMVVFEDGLARKSEYRRFAIRAGRDDVASMHETINRRFSRYLAERARAATRGPGPPAAPRNDDRTAAGTLGTLGEAADAGATGGSTHTDASGVDTATGTAATGTADIRTAGPGTAGTGTAGTDASGAGHESVSVSVSVSESESGEPVHPVHDGAPAAAEHRPAPGLDPETGRPRRFAYPPNLVVVDGGAPQVAAARRALDELGIDGGAGGVALCGLAKRLEEVWLPDSDEPVILPRTSEALYLLQRIRDEAHRFAITYHRQKRSKSMVASALDNVPGLGQTRRKALLRHFGSLAKLREATAEQIADVPGIGAKTAAAVAAALAATAPGSAAAPPPAVDPTTGEIIEASGPTAPAAPSPEGAPQAPPATPPPPGETKT